MVEFILYLFLGMCFGVLTGLLPGLHPNTLVLFASPLYLLFSSDTNFLIFLTAVGVTNTIISFLPSTFIGAPDESTALTVLPAHKLLLKGRGYEAVKLYISGCTLSLILSFILLPLLILIIPEIYKAIRPLIHVLLSFVVAYLIFIERRRVKALVVFLLSGALGLMMNRIPIDGRIVLFPVLTGLFGLPLLFLSLRSDVRIPEQRAGERKLSSKTLRNSTLIGTVSGILVGLLPGVGPAQATTVASMGKMKTEGFLISMGAVSLSNFIFSILAIWLIGKPRSGIAVIINRFITIGFNEFIIVCFTALFTCGIASILALKLTKYFIRVVEKIDYRLIVKSVLIFLFVLIYVFSGFYGIYITLVASAIGMYANLVNVRRTHLMGVLILPNILFFAGVI